MSDHIRVRRENGLFEVTLARPPLNILHGPMMEELTAAFEACARDAEARLLLVRAEGKVFSAGADIDEHRPGKAQAMIEAFHGMFRRLDAVPCPTMAFVHGAALGGGCELALGCDLILAGTKAKLGQPEIGLGFLPPVAAAVLPERVSWATAVQLCCTGQPLAAAEALAAGLVHGVLPEENTEEALSAALTPYMKQSAHILRLTKKALRAGGEKGFLPRLAVAERIFLDELMASDDVAEGLAAFDEKRAPCWKNR